MLEWVKSHSCGRSNCRGIQSFLWQTKTGGRMQDIKWVGEESCKNPQQPNHVTKKSDLSGKRLSHTHTVTKTNPRCKDKEVDLADQPVAPPLKLWANFPAWQSQHRFRRVKKFTQYYIIWLISDLWSTSPVFTTLCSLKPPTLTASILPPFPNAGSGTSDELRSNTSSKHRLAGWAAVRQCQMQFTPFCHFLLSQSEITRRVFLLPSINKLRHLH